MVRLCSNLLVMKANVRMSDWTRLLVSSMELDGRRMSFDELAYHVLT
jgi:hypothetical protein